MSDLDSLDPDLDVSESGSNADLDPGQDFFMVFLNPSSPTKISLDMKFLNFFPFVGDNFRMPGSGSNPDLKHWIEHNGVKHKCSTQNLSYAYTYLYLLVDSSWLRWGLSRSVCDPVPSSCSVIYRALLTIPHS